MAAMSFWQPRANGLSRRRLLTELTGVGVALSTAAPALWGETSKHEILPADWGRYSDPSTEFEVLRLTHPSYASYLAAPPGRSVSRHGDFAILASDRTGSLQLLRLDLKSGQSRVLTDAAHLHPGAFTLSADDRTAYYLDGAELCSVALGNARVMKHWTAAQAFEQTTSLAPADDGTAIWFAVNTGSGALMRFRPAAKTGAEPVLRHDGAMVDPAPNPRRALIAWRGQDGSAWVCEQDGGNKRRLETQPGKVLQVLWNADGQSVLYLQDPGVPGASVAIREQEVDTRVDRLVAKTSQYACFARNANGTVFAGASRSKASPYALLMLRVTERELTLCEHRSRDAATAAIAFSPDSQRLVFQGAKEGRMAVYSIRLEKLVEKTES